MLLYLKFDISLQSSDDKMNQNLIPRKSLADEVAAKLQEQILKGVYKVFI